MGELITSKSNSRIKRLKSLELKKNRQKEGVFLIEGMRLIEQAFENGANIESIYVSSTFCGSGTNEAQLAFYHSNCSDLCEVDDSVFNQLTATVNGQGCIAVAKIPTFDFANINKNRPILVLDRIQDPGNLGTMVRTADAAGFAAVICIKGTVDIYNDKTVRSTMGSLFSMPVFYMDQDQFKGAIAALNYQVVVADLESAIPYTQAHFVKQTALVIGNEGNGISSDMRALANQSLIIPLYGNAESLNAAVAAGILMYHIVHVSNGVE